MSAISKMFVSHLADKGIRGSRVSSVKVTFHLKHLPDHSIHSDSNVDLMSTGKAQGAGSKP